MNLPSTVRGWRAVERRQKRRVGVNIRAGASGGGTKDSFRVWARAAGRGRGERGRGLGDGVVLGVGLGWNWPTVGGGWRTEGCFARAGRTAAGQTCAGSLFMCVQFQLLFFYTSIERYKYEKVCEKLINCKYKNYQLK